MTGYSQVSVCDNDNNNNLHVFEGLVQGDAKRARQDIAYTIIRATQKDINIEGCELCDI